MRPAIALALLVACGGATSAPPPREPSHVAEPAPPPEPSPPTGWIAFEHDLWRGHVPSTPEVTERYDDRPPTVRRAMIAKGPLPEGMWLVGAYELEAASVTGADPYAVIEASRDGLLGSTGMNLDTEQRTSITIDGARCPALHFRSHSDHMGAAVTMFLCGARMMHLAWVVSAELAPASVDPARVEAQRDLLLASIHLRD